ncbi:MAG: hypothetical protein M0T78_00880 [Actinomycetota bacterium]|nr:hypothetical protein [Actinomycetota bacterium]
MASLDKVIVHKAVSTLEMEQVANDISENGDVQVMAIFHRHTFSKLSSSNAM